MRLGSLDDLFDGVVWKRLTEHEVNPRVSNGHEFQGVAQLRDLLGPTEQLFAATYILLADEGQLVISSVAKWYDARENQAHRSPEWRLYYPSEAGQIQMTMRAGDLAVIARTRSNDLIIILARAGSTSEAELKTLFRIGAAEFGMQLQRFDQRADVSVLGARILEQIGVTPPIPDPVGDGPTVMEIASELVNSHPEGLPSGKEVSKLIRARLRDVNPIEDADDALVRWIEAEDQVFRLWENGLIERRLEAGFNLPGGGKDVQGFRDFSMRIRQSRVSRAGGALQLHTAAILRAHKIPFAEQAVTEHGEKPDFLFPSAEAYRDPQTPAASLRMLGVKFTAKDRWRQVLNEAARISQKHLLTLEAPISDSQLAAMRAAGLIPVIPGPYHSVFGAVSRTHLVRFGEFVGELRALHDH